MANAEDLEKLCQGPKAWNDWRAESPERIPDLRNVRLTLSQRQFGPSNGGPVNFQDTDLEGAELRHANLSGAQMAYANMLAADLVHARLNDADLTGADLTDALIDNADLTGAKLDRAILIGASLADARGLTQEQIDAAYGDASTILPASVMPPASWFPPVEDEFFNECPTPEAWEETDLYEVLGVARNAKPEEIRASFRVLVKKLHPDLNPDDDEAQEAFKRVSNAYRILNNADMRKRYDRGEIGADGEVNPEFEAKRQFRRYAFRFYSAAAGSLVLAIGVLVAVWYVVLTEDAFDRGGRVEIAIGAPPKHIDRLDEKLPATPSTKAGEIEAKKELAAAAPVSETPQAQGKRAAGAAAQDAAPQSEPAASKTADAAPAKTEPAPAPEPVKQAQAAPEKQPRSAPIQDAPQLSAKPDQTLQTSADLTSAPPPISLTSPSSPAPNQTPIKESAPSGAAVISAPASVPAQTTPAALKPERLASLTETGQTNSQSVANPAGPQQPEANARPSPGQQPEGATRPLGKQNSDREARPANADAARFSSPVPLAPKLPAKTDDKAGLGLGASGQTLNGPDGLYLRNAQDGRRTLRGPISKLFRSRAIRNSLAQDKANTTASVEAGAADKPGNDEEVWDVYTHSLPETGQKFRRPWPESLATPSPAKKKQEKPSAPIVSSSAAKTVAPQPSAASATAAAGVSPSAPAAPGLDNKVRKQAVSDILSGGL